MTAVAQLEAGPGQRTTRRGSQAVTPDNERANVLVNGGDSVRAQVVNMTPALAQALLQRNRKNRRISQGRVEVYSRDMAAGRWQFNNQGIAIGRDGELYDGQHRLLAILQADVTVPMLVVSGLDGGARVTIDQGRTRSVGDVMRIVDGQKNGSTIVSWFRAIESLTAKRRLPLSHGMVQEQLARYDTSVKWFLANVPRRRDLTRASVVGALLYAHRVAGEDVARFTKRYLSGVDLGEGSPILALRNYVTQRMHIDDDPRLLSMKTLRCVQAELCGETIERIFASEDVLEHFRRLHDERDAAA
jgi:hypothetical protein